MWTLCIVTLCLLSVVSSVTRDSFLQGFLGFPDDGIPNATVVTPSFNETDVFVTSRPCPEFGDFYTCDSIDGCYAYYDDDGCLICQCTGVNVSYDGDVSDMVRAVLLHLAFVAHNNAMQNHALTQEVALLLHAISNDSDTGSRPQETNPLSGPRPTVAPDSGPGPLDIGPLLSRALTDASWRRAEMTKRR